MSRPARSMLMLAFTAVAFMTIGRAPRAVVLRSHDPEVVAMVEAETGA